MISTGKNSRFLYGAIIFFNAFLLFQIQPLLGKFILPWFGSSPRVWSILLMFFQALLLLGYSYAYLLSAAFPIKKQVIIHASFIALSLLSLRYATDVITALN